MRTRRQRGRVPERPPTGLPRCPLWTVTSMDRRGGVGRLGPWSLSPFFLLILFLGFLFYPLRGKHLSWYQNTQLLGPQ